MKLDKEGAPINGKDVVISSSADPPSVDETELAQPFEDKNGQNRSSLEELNAKKNLSNSVDMLTEQVSSPLSYGTADFVTTVQAEDFEHAVSATLSNEANANQEVTTTKLQSASQKQQTSVGAGESLKFESTYVSHYEVNSVSIDGSQAISAESLMSGSEGYAGSFQDDSITGTIINNGDNVAAEPLMGESGPTSSEVAADGQVIENASAPLVSNFTGSQFNCQEQIFPPVAPVQNEQSQRSERSQNGSMISRYFFIKSTS